MTDVITPGGELQGSQRSALPGARLIGPARPDERLEISVLVRRRSAPEFHARVADLAAGNRARGRMTHADFARLHGADPADFAAVRGFAVAHGILVVQEHAARRTVILAGTVAQFSAAFGVQLHDMHYDGGSYRGRTGTITLPAELTDIVEAVLGLDNRPQARPHFRLRRAASPAATSYSPTQLASLYDFPAGAGAGECVALVELGGGFTPVDLAAYFADLGVTAPRVVAVSVDQARNAPTGAANGPDGEVMLDIEVVGAIAPKATIAVYFAPNTDAGFLDAVTTAIHDTTHKPSVISISWGGPEATWTTQAKTAMDSAFQAAAALGITICVASGDNGSSDGVAGGADTVDFPASSAFALACGGTSLRASTSAVTTETVWNDGTGGGATGGGVSDFFALPAWQSGVTVQHTNGASGALTRRGVPDVSGDADPETGYQVRVAGSDTVIGGTSAVAPLWAALIARLNANSGRTAGFVNPLLYQNAAACRDITQGDNGDFTATVGWDACTGLGSPQGAAVAKLFS